MITGYNTDVEHDGVVYHVQTEDKGHETPIILSLVYTGGAILASKRSPYNDLIASGFSEVALAKRLKRQHGIICGAIKAGRIEELKRLGAPEAEQATRQTTAESPDLKLALEEPVEEASRAAPPVAVAIEPHVIKPSQRESAAYTVYDPRRKMSPADTSEQDEGLRVRLLDEAQEFRGGDSLTLQILVTQLSTKGEKPMNGAVVSVKILGAGFRPLIYSLKTGRDGLVTVSIEIPRFTSGRAAVLVQASAGELSTETRRIIYPGE